MLAELGLAEMGVSVTQEMHPSHHPTEKSAESVDARPVDPGAFTSEERQLMFKTALSQWEEAFKPEKIMKYVTSGSALSEKQVNKLKAMRIKGQQLATVYKLFDERENLPQPYVDLLKAMGQIKDLHAADDTDKNAKRANKQRNKILNALGQIAEEKPELELQPVTDETYRGRVNSIMQSINAKANNPALRVPVFHDMRKDIRHLDNLFQLAAVTQNAQSPAHEQVAGALSVLNRILGIKHDAEKVGSLNVKNGKQEYETKPVVINTEQRMAIKTVLGKMGFRDHTRPLAQAA